MKKLRYLLLLILPMTVLLHSCELLQGTELTEEEVVAALKEALEIGSEKSTAKANAQDGYFGNQLIKIVFPDEASIVESTVSALPGGQQLIDALVLKLNRAAEDAADDALPIFVDAITTMTVDDGMAILMGEDDAATDYLNNRTYTSLKDAFKPQIQSSLDAVGATAAWTSVMNTYNNIPFVQPVNTDLADYTTGKALDGLFVLVAEEELLIREDASARVTDLLAKVFAEQDN